MSRIIIELDKTQEVVPLGFQILVRIDKEEKVSDGGIIMATNLQGEKGVREQRRQNRGVVIAVGPLAGRDPGDKPENWGAEIGTEVCFEEYEGQPYLTHEGDVIMCIPEKAVYSKIVIKSKVE